MQRQQLGMMSFQEMQVFRAKMKAWISEKNMS